MPVVIQKLIGSYTDNFFNTRLYREVVNKILQYPFPGVLSDKKQRNKCQKQIETHINNSFFKPKDFSNTNSEAPEVKVGDFQYHRLDNPTMLLR